MARKEKLGRVVPDPLANKTKYGNAQSITGKHHSTLLPVLGQIQLQQRRRPLAGRRLHRPPESRVLLVSPPPGHLWITWMGFWIGMRGFVGMRNGGRLGGRGGKIGVREAVGLTTIVSSS